MADFQTALGFSRGRTGVKGAKKLSTRVDLTPMVDLGFLLITFFVFTTSLQQPNSMSMIIPAKGDSTQTAESKTLNLVLSAENKVHYYIGNDVGKQGCTDFSTQGVRKVISGMQETVQARFGDRGQLVILIRPTNESSYMNLVDILDEMLILDVKKYALMEEPSDEIIAAIRKMTPC